MLTVNFIKLTLEHYIRYVYKCYMMIKNVSQSTEVVCVIL